MVKYSFERIRPVHQQVQHPHLDPLASNSITSADPI
jgi:hypothetical protein